MKVPLVTFGACLATAVTLVLTVASASSSSSVASGEPSKSNSNQRSSFRSNINEKASPLRTERAGEQSESTSGNGGGGIVDSKFTARQTPPEGLLKEFWQSLYVDRTFNSSFALNVPLFTLTIPGYGRGLKTPTALSALNVGNLAVLGIVVLGGLALVAPVIFPEVRRRRSLEGDKWSRSGFDPLDFARFVGRNFQAPPTGGAPLTADERQAHGIQGLLTRGLVGVSESIMGWVERSVDDLPSFPRLDAQECMKRSVCEAHNQPKKYGALGLALQLFFPPYTETDESKVRVVSKYQLAARYGRQDNANCSSQYDGCMVNILDIVQVLINLVF